MRTARIEQIEGYRLAGLHCTMSLADDRTQELFRAFMPRRKELTALSEHIFCVQVYGPEARLMTGLQPDLIFEKWAALAVGDAAPLPSGMDMLQVPAGLYAVFLHHGGPATGAETFRFIYESWLPASGYILANRPHFEVLGPAYKGNAPDSEEEIWIPVRPASGALLTS